MAEQVEKITPDHVPPPQPPQESLLVVCDVPDDSTLEEAKPEPQSLVVPEAESPPSSAADSDDGEPLKSEDKTAAEDSRKSFSDILPENEKKALQELKHLLQEALSNHSFFGSFSASITSHKEEKTSAATEEGKKIDYVEDGKESDDGAKTLEAIEETIVAPAKAPEEIKIWGVKLLEDDQRSDVVLLKFLRAREFKVMDAFTMIKNTVKWRKEFGIDELVEEEDDLCYSDLERVVFMHGYSKEGHPVCFNVYGEFQDKELYRKMFSDEEKRKSFLRWRIRFLEKGVRELDFGYGGVSTIVQVNDIKNSPGPNRWELRQATSQALQLLQDNYPEFVAKQIFINVPWWYLALSKMISPFLTQRTKSKFVVAGPSKSTETLLKYISAEQIPTQYGGLSKDGDFGMADSVTEVIVKPYAKHIVEFPVAQVCEVRWEARVVGWEVSYGAEFVPSAEEGYTIIIQKIKRIGDDDKEQVISCSYKVGEPGKLVLTINNLTSKKKKLLYRFNTKAFISAN